MAHEVSVEALAQRLDAQETVFIAGSSGEPLEFTGLLAGDPALARQTRFITTFVPGINRYDLVPAGSERRMCVFFHAPGCEQARRRGAIEFRPLTYSGIRQHLADEATTIDTVVLQVSPPGSDGHCSLGPAVEFLPTVLHRRVQVYAILNSQVPDLPGSVRVPMESFTAYAHSAVPVAEYHAGAPNDTTARIAQHLLPFIPSGATLQIGLGKVPSQLVPGLAARRDMAFHGGLLSDSVVDLAETGALRAQSALTTAVVVGSTSVYRRLGALAGLCVTGVEHTHGMDVLAGLPNLFAINSGIEVDLLGQVNAETIGGRYVSGPGGLPDFAHAARRSAGGLSIIALNSTDASGRLSKIVPLLAAGTPVTVPYHDVDAVVTEWGVAMLRGCDLAERAHRLIAVAHPEHRQLLLAHPPR